MFLIGRELDKKTVGWLCEAKGKKFSKDIQRVDPIVVTWTRVATNAKVYQTSDDAHYVCEMVWGNRNPNEICVDDVSADDIRSGKLNISELEKARTV